MKTKRTVIVQCRLSSNRLPEKAIKLLGGKPVLAWVLASMHKIKADRYFVATDEASYPILKKICDENDFECFAGDLNNVLKRFCDLIQKIKGETIIRATADNPFLFYEAVEASVLEFEERNKKKLTCDYLTYTGLPHGSGVEIFNGKSLLLAASQTEDPYDQEHVGPALYNHKDKFNCEFIKAPSRFYHPELRTTIDTYSDYLRAVSIVNYLSEKNIKEPYSTEQILEACTSSYVQKPVVFVPSVKKGQGTGHLHRCLKAAIDSKGFVYIPKACTLEGVPELIKSYCEAGLNELQIIDELPDETFMPVIVTDTFSLTEDEAKAYSNARALISIDEGSEFSNYSDYLLDIIPSYKLERKANLSDAGFIEVPSNVRKERKLEFKNILVCLGGEDPAGLTIPAANNLSKIYPKSEIKAVIAGDIEKVTCGKTKIDNIEFTGPIENLKEKLYEYDLVVTHYGLTAFEAAAAGCAVLLLGTSKLHEKLAEKYDFAFVPQHELMEKKMRECLLSENIFPVSPATQARNEDSRKSLGEYINKVAAGNRMCCPVCGTAEENQNPFVNPVVSRNAYRTYRRCSECGLVYMSFTIEPEKKYQKAYFFEDYKKQYGKTYKEDFDNIKKECSRRIGIITEIKPEGNSRNVLDIGCAYGPFLAAAGEGNMNPFGTDISDDAVDYVKKELHYPASCTAFPNIDTVSEFGVSHFDVVTMWYVIEHFKNLDTVLKKVNSIIKTGGIFAFSTPSAEGVSAKYNLDNFYTISPSDHYSVWEPSRAQKILSKYGFIIEKIVSTGHHPERFPSIKKSEAKKGSLKWKMVDKYSRMMNLGDTVEIYCRKVR